MTQNGQKWPQKGPKWSEMFRQMVQMRPVIPTPNFPTVNGGKLPKNHRKMAKMTLKWPKMAQNGLKWPINGPNNCQFFFRKGTPFTF